MFEGELLVELYINFFFQILSNERYPQKLSGPFELLEARRRLNCARKNMSKAEQNKFKFIRTVYPVKQLLGSYFCVQQLAAVDIKLAIGASYTT